MRKEVCRVCNIGNEENDYFTEVLNILKENGYEIIDENYPYTVIAVTGRDQNEGINNDND